MNDGHDVLGERIGEGRRDFLRVSGTNAPGSKSFGQLHEIDRPQRTGDRLAEVSNVAQGRRPRRPHGSPRLLL